MSVLRTRNIDGMHIPTLSTLRSVNLDVKPDIDIRGGSGESTTGFSKENTFENPLEDPGLMARAARGTKREAIKSAAKFNDTLKDWVAFGDTVVATLELGLGLREKLSNTAEGAKKALSQRASLLVAREMVKRGFETIHAAITQLVQQNPKLAPQLSPLLQTLSNRLGSLMKKFDGPLNRIQHFIIANKSKLDKLPPRDKALGAIGDSLAVAGAVTGGVSVAANSPAQTLAGKVINGLLDGLIGFLFNKANGTIATLDGFMGSNISNALAGTVAMMVAGGEAAVTGDITGLLEVANRLEKKEYGGILNAAYNSGKVLDKTINTVNAAIESLKNPVGLRAFVEAAMRGEHGVLGTVGTSLGFTLGQMVFGDA